MYIEAVEINSWLFHIGDCGCPCDFARNIEIDGRRVVLHERRSWDRKTEDRTELFKVQTARRPILRGSKVHELFLSYFGLFALQFWHKNTPIRDGNSIEIYG